MIAERDLYKAIAEKACEAIDDSVKSISARLDHFRSLVEEGR
jgi:hypothetical protein